MKKSGIFVLAALCAGFLGLAPARLSALEFVIAGGAGNSGYAADGTLPRAIGPNIVLGASGQIRDFLSAGVTIEQDSVFGRKLAADLSFDVGFIKITAGPVFGILNGTDGTSWPSGALLQPGLRLGFSLFFLDRILIEASSDFCFQLEDSSSPQFYPSKGKIGVGLVFSAINCSLEINQKSAVLSGSGGYTHTRTDYGLYTRVFGKNSPVRLGVNFIYRTLDYETNTAESSTKSLVAGGGVDVRVKMVDIFVDFEGSVYTFEDSGNNPFMFDAMAGVRIRAR